MSEIVVQDDPDQLLDSLTAEQLSRLTAGLDRAEALRIWEQAALDDSELFSGKLWLQQRLLRDACDFRKPGWAAFHAALIGLSTEFYLDWCRRHLARLAEGDDDDDETDEGLRFVLPILITAVGTEDAAALAQAVAALPSIRTRMKLLDLLATTSMPAGAMNPILVLAQAANPILAFGIRDCWESCFADAAKTGKGLWEDYVLKRRLPRFPAVATLVATHFPAQLELEFGYSAGIRAETLDDVPRILTQLGIREHAEVFLPMGKLWFLLKQMHALSRSGDHETEMAGLRAELLALVGHRPQLWPVALKWILLHAADIKNEVTAITSRLCGANPAIAAALRQMHDVPAVSLLARGILALVDGIAAPADQHTLALANSLAQYFDGTPKFPSPLALRSATWLGSGRVEAGLRDGVSRARSHFAAHVKGNVGSVEEALTEHLMTEIQAAFRGADHLPLGSDSEAYGVPSLKISRREVSKGKEEKKYGCDLAFLVRVQAQGVYQMEWAAVVQVKKTLAKPGSSTADTWEIKVAQLETLLKTCPSAVYFLICGHGEVLVVPARHLFGFVRGKAQLAVTKSRDLGYNDVRSAAIPLEQYIVDLLVGQWTGSSDDAMIAFVQNDQGLGPRHLVELDIEFAPRKKG